MKNSARLALLSSDDDAHAVHGGSTEASLSLTGHSELKLVTHWRWKMPNAHMLKRLVGIQNMLIGARQASSPLSANSKGGERQTFIDSFLTNVFPSIYRFGTGDATDVAGRKSGQLDVVVEYPFSPSLPGIGGGIITRLYLAEAIAAVVEVKSDIASQWDEARHTAAQLAPLRRNFGAQMTMGDFPLKDQIPLFVAGYTGWKKLETIRSNLTQASDIAGVLVIDAGTLVSSAAYGGAVAEGPWALWGMITALHQITNALQAASTNPAAYAR